MFPKFLNFYLAVSKWYLPVFKKYVSKRLDEFAIDEDTYPPGIELYDEYNIYFFTPFDKKRA